MFVRDIYATKPEVSVNTIRGRIARLKDRNKIEKIQNGLYKLVPALETQTPLDKQLNEIAEALRSPDANKNTIDRLMNLYDVVVGNYETWIAKNLNSKVDFEKQLLFIENFKWLTSIGDKLMKRWSLEHKGYDTNTRQAQEDAKAQTAAREKAALEDAPLEDTVHVVGHYHTDLKELWDAMPASEKEKRKV